jgi:hypothetical protein
MAKTVTTPPVWEAAVFYLTCPEHLSLSVGLCLKHTVSVAHCTATGLLNMTVSWDKWLTPISLADGEAEIGRKEIRGQPLANSSGDLISKITRAKWTGGVAQVVAPALQVQSPEFKPQSHQ